MTWKTNSEKSSKISRRRDIQQGAIGGLHLQLTGELDGQQRLDARSSYGHSEREQFPLRSTLLNCGSLETCEVN
jgi:hypothetical protein